MNSMNSLPFNLKRVLKRMTALTKLMAQRRRRRIEKLIRTPDLRTK